MLGAGRARKGFLEEESALRMVEVSWGGQGKYSTEGTHEHGGMESYSVLL